MTQYENPPFPARSRRSEARAAASEVPRISPDLSLPDLSLPDLSLKVTRMGAAADPKLTDVYIEDFRKAGRPERCKIFRYGFVTK